MVSTNAEKKPVHQKVESTGAHVRQTSGERQGGYFDVMSVVTGITMQVFRPVSGVL